MLSTFTVTDEDLRADVEEELDWDPAVPSTNIGVSATDHTVTLSGAVHTLADRLAAVKAARRVKGVHAIVDEIVVRPKDGAGTSDQHISAAVERVLEYDTLVPSSVKAVVRAGTITLTGTVDWQYQKEAAQRAVRDLKGVGWVQNDIVVKPAASTPVVRSRIVSALHRNADIDARDIHVAVTDGQVWLSGHVHSLAAKGQAERAAWSAPGVTQVHNAITLA